MCEQVAKSTAHTRQGQLRFAEALSEAQAAAARPARTDRSPARCARPHLRSPVATFKQGGRPAVALLAHALSPAQASADDKRGSRRGATFPRKRRTLARLPPLAAVLLLTRCSQCKCVRPLAAEKIADLRTRRRICNLTPAIYIIAALSLTTCRPRCVL